MMEWGDAPLSVKACYALLVVIGVIASIHAWRLLLALYAGPRERHTLRLLMAGSISAASAAGAGLAGKIDVPDAADAGTHPSGSSELARARLRSAEARFALGWREAYADVVSMRSLAWLALILAATSVTWDLVDAYSREYDHRNYVPVYAVTLAASKLTTRLGFGFAVCAVFLVLSAFCDQALLRRRAQWKFACALAREETSAPAGPRAEEADA